jgi:hypothetical protein
MAEGEGFEPPLPVRVKRFSRPPVSTTHTSLREWRCTLMIARRLAKANENAARGFRMRTLEPRGDVSRCRLQFPLWD